MFFQVLDEKRKCKTVFFNDTLFDEFDSNEMTHTWSFSPNLDGENLEYASVWCEGATLDQVCPERLKDRWREVNKRAKAFFSSFKIAKISLEDNCLFVLLPEGFFLDFYSLKNEITKSVFESFQKPKNYDFMSDLVAFLHRIKNRKLNLNFENLDFANDKVRNNFGKIKAVSYTHLRAHET